MHACHRAAMKYLIKTKLAMQACHRAALKYLIKTKLTLQTGSVKLTKNQTSYEACQRAPLTHFPSYSMYFGVKTKFHH